MTTTAGARVIDAGLDASSLIALVGLVNGLSAFADPCTGRVSCAGFRPLLVEPLIVDPASLPAELPDFPCCKLFLRNQSMTFFAGPELELLLASERKLPDAVGGRGKELAFVSVGRKTEEVGVLAVADAGAGARGAGRKEEAKEKVESRRVRVGLALSGVGGRGSGFVLEVADLR